MGCQNLNNATGASLESCRQSSQVLGTLQSDKGCGPLQVGKLEPYKRFTWSKRCVLLTPGQQSHNRPERATTSSQQGLVPSFATHPLLRLRLPTKPREDWDILCCVWTTNHLHKLKQCVRGKGIRLLLKRSYAACIFSCVFAAYSVLFFGSIFVRNRRQACVRVATRSTQNPICKLICGRSWCWDPQHWNWWLWETDSDTKYCYLLSHCCGDKPNDWPTNVNWSTMWV